MKHVLIYTDGACSGNPGPGGWGAVLLYNEYKKEISGGEPDTTNNRMELTAAIQALSLLKESCEVDLYTDSTYLCNGFSKQWVDQWIRNGWKTSAKKPVENQDLWKELIRLNSEHQITFHWDKGHASNPLNNRCDHLATEALKEV